MIHLVCSACIVPAPYAFMSVNGNDLPMKKNDRRQKRARDDAASYEEAIARAEKLSEEERMKLARKILVAAV